MSPLDVRRTIAITRTWFPLLVVSVVLAAGAAYLVSGVLPKVYEAKSTLIVGQSLSTVNPDYSQLLVSQRLSATYAAVATTRPILDAVVKQLDLSETSDELAKRVRATAPLDSTLLTISAQDADPTRAAAIANAMARQLLVASPAIQGRQAEIQTFIDASLQATQTQIEATQTQIDALNAIKARTAAQETDLAALDARLVSLRASYAGLLAYFSGSASNLLSIVEPAAVPLDHVSPKQLQNTILAALLGLLVAVGIVVLVAYLNDGIRDSDDVLAVAGLSTLGTIVRMTGGKTRSEMYRLAAILYPRSVAAEAYRTLRTNVEFSSLDVPVQTLLVTSSMPSEGKTVTAANLAVVFAQAGRKVLLVDADLRKPGVHLVFDLPNSQGLTTLLRGDDVSLDAIAQRTEEKNLRILTTGPLPPNPAELIGSQRMRSLLERLKTGADLVIMDSPPLRAVTDSAILSSLADGTLVVIDAKVSRRRPVRQALEALAKAGANVLGAVLNRIPAQENVDYISYYGGQHDASTDVPGPAAHVPETS